MDVHNTVEDCFLKPNCNISVHKLSSCSSKTIISNNLPKILLIAILSIVIRITTIASFDFRNWN